MIKIVFTGPECSGKTTLSIEIAKQFNAPLVQEYAREYLENIKRDYNYNDLIQIAKGQLKIEQEYSKKTNQLLICDTNLQVIKIWSQIKYAKCDSFILKNLDTEAYYVLCYPDFPWEYDPLRENEHDRIKLAKHYHQDLIENNYKFIIARGSHKKRTSFVKSVINKMIIQSF